VFIKDRTTGITGGAHIFLPEFFPNISFSDSIAASACIEEMLERMTNKGASLKTMRAKIVGGSNVLMHFHEVGSRNTREVIGALVRNKIYIAAKDVGGTISRTVQFDSISEALMVRQLEWNSTKIF
jgi:chemotaxis protein CheD